MITNKLIFAFTVFSLGLFASRLIWLKLSKIRRNHNGLWWWLREIASDISLAVASISIVFSAALALSIYFDSAIAISLYIIKLILVVFSALIISAALTVIEVFVIERIKAADIDLQDKSNFYTLVSIANSLLKLLVYLLAIITALGVLDVDLTPFFGIGAIAGIALSLAGQSILNDVLSTLILLTDRVYHVGDSIEVYLPDNQIVAGTVVKVTAFRTFIECHVSKEKIAVANRLATTVKIKARHTTRE